MQIPKKITVGRKTYAVIKVKKAKTKKWRGGGGRQGRGCDLRLAVEEREGGNPPLTSPRPHGGLQRMCDAGTLPG